MSSPFNLSLCFTIVLTRISSVFEELISRPAYVTCILHWNICSRKKCMLLVLPFSLLCLSGSNNCNVLLSGNKIVKNSYSSYLSVENCGSGRSWNNVIAVRIALGKKTIDEGNAKLMTLLGHQKTQNTVVARKRKNTTGINPKYLLTPRCRILLEKLTGLKLVKKFPTFYGTRRFITALTSVHHLSLSWASPIQSIYPHSTCWRHVLILSSHLRLGLPSSLFPSGFPIKNLYTPSLHPYAPRSQPISIGINPK